MRAVNAINVIDVFSTVISFVSQIYIVQLLYHVSNLLTSACKNLNDSVHYTVYTTPTPLASNYKIVFTVQH